MDTKMNIKIKKLHPDAIIPKYATKGSACFDLHADSDAIVEEDSPSVLHTGIAVEIPDGYAMMIYSRSGHGFKNDTRLANCVGILDSDYRGEILVKLTADKGGQLVVQPGDRIAQAMIVPINQVKFEEVNELSETERGQGGFGSTGK